MRVVGAYLMIISLRELKLLSECVKRLNALLIERRYPKVYITSCSNIGPSFYITALSTTI